MKTYINKHIKRPMRLNALPESMREKLKTARIARGWSQARLGQEIGLPQMHISGIENGKIMPRFNTLLDYVRVLNFDLLMVPRTLVPAVQALVRDQDHPTEEERSIYADEKNNEGDN